MSRALRTHKRLAPYLIFASICCALWRDKTTLSWSRVDCKRCLRLKRRQNGS